jgi:hypothetical protein
VLVLLSATALYRNYCGRDADDRGLHQQSGPTGILMTPQARPAGTVRPSRDVQDGVDDDERVALRAEGLDPDDPAVIAAIDLVRWDKPLPC